MSIKYRTGQGTSASDFTDVVVKVGDTLPIGTEVDYDGQTVPAGWQEVDDPNVYSTSEKVVGTWIDGKPLYRKVVSLGALPNNANKLVNANLSNLDTVYRLYGIAPRSGAKSAIPLPYASASNNIELLFDGTNIMIITSSDRSGFVGYVIIEYTKTTD